MQIFHLFALIALIGLSSVTQASSYLSKEIKREFASEILPIKSLLPGYQRNVFDAPRFAVAEFRIADEDLRHWSQAFAEILRYRIQYVPGSRLYMPAPYYTHVDAGIVTDEDRPLVTRPKAFRTLYDSLGIDTVLTGQIETRGSKFALTVELVETKSAKVLAKRKWSFAEDRLPDVITIITKWVYEFHQIKLTSQEMEYIEDRSAIEIDAIETFLDNYHSLVKLEGLLQTQKVESLYDDHPNFPLLAVYRLHTRKYGQNLDEAYQNLELYKEIRSRFVGHAGVELESYRVMEIESMPKHEVSSRLTRLRDLVVRNPQDPTMMIVYADALIQNGQTFEGIGILLEVTDRWPGQYRGWWSLGWALNQHAWQVRGNDIWRNVPVKAQEVYTLLSDYSNLAVDKALSLNPYSPNLWNMKLNAIGSKDGFTDELLEVFDKAAEIAPRNRLIYENAMNYSLARWGGHASARLHIIETAEKNNPDSPAWLQSLKKRHVVDLDNWQKRLGTSAIENFIKAILDHPSGKYIGAVVIIVVLFVVFQMGRRSA